MFVYPLTRSAHSAARAAQQFDRAIDRALDASTDRFFGGAKPGSTARTPALDVAESDTAFTVSLDVPGVIREQLKVTIEGRRLAIETTDAPEAAATPIDGGRVLYRERGAARFARTVILPAEVDQVASQAKVENGVLTLTLAKKVPAGALQIAIG